MEMIFSRILVVFVKINKPVCDHKGDGIRSLTVRLLTL